MSQLYQAPDSSPHSGLSLVLGLLLALLIFLLIPLSQDAPIEAIEPVEMLELVAPPLPPPPVVLPAPAKSEPQVVSPPELFMLEPVLDVARLQLDSLPQLNADFSPQLSLDLDLQVELAQELASIFDFSELDALPRLLRRGSPRMPQSLAFNRLMQQDVSKQVTLVVVIDARGAVQVLQVQSYSHQVLVAAAQQAAQRSRFSPPLVDGQAVRAQYTWRLSF